MDRVMKRGEQATLLIRLVFEEQDATMYRGIKKALEYRGLFFVISVSWSESDSIKSERECVCNSIGHLHLRGFPLACTQTFNTEFIARLSIR